MSRMQPSAASVSSEDQRLEVENAWVVRTPPGAAWKSSTASADGCLGANVPRVEPRLERGGVHGVDVGVQHSGPPQLAEDRRDAARAVHVLHVEIGVGRHLGHARHPPRDGVDRGEVEVDLALLRRGQDVQHRVGGAAHRDVERHRVLERRAVGDVARAAQRRRPPRTSRLASSMTVRARPLEQVAAGGVGGQRRAVAGQRQAERLGEAVHRVGGEHPRARAACRAGRALDQCRAPRRRPAVTPTRRSP